MTTVLAAAFMGVPRSQCVFEETFEDLGGTQYFKRVKVTDCEQDDCPLSVTYAPPRRDSGSTTHNAVPPPRLAGV